MRRRILGTRRITPRAHLGPDEQETKPRRKCLRCSKPVDKQPDAWFCHDCRLNAARNTHLEGLI